MHFKNNIIVFLLIITGSYYSQSPSYINYQAVVRDGNGNIIINTSVPVTITIGSCTVYNGNPTTNDYGLINLELNLTNCSPAIDWSSGNLTISSSINSVSGTSDLNSVPYSIYSNQVRNYPTSGDVNSDGYVLSWNENNGEFELTPASSGTDDQNISGSSLNGTTLTIGIEDGNSEDVDLSSLQDGYEANTDDQTAGEVSYSSTSSGLNATTVQDAIDEIDGKLATTNLTTDYIPKWDGSSFVNTTIFEETISGSYSKLGIGTSTPKEKFHIASTLPEELSLHLSVEASNTTSKRASGISFSHDNNANAGISAGKLAAFIKAEQYAVNDNRTNLVFGTRSTNSSTETASDKLVLRYDGNLGIGVGDPQYKLDLGGGAGPINEGIRAPRLLTNNIKPTSSGSSISLSNYDENSAFIVKDDGDIEIGNDDETSSTEIYGTTVAKYIEATDAIGLQLKDQSGNLGIHLSDGGNVGIGTLATSSKLAVDGDLDVVGDLDVDGNTRIGWRGYEDKIIITPSDLIIDDDNGEFSDLSYNGGSIEVSNGTDAYVNVVIPAGYYCSQYRVYFDNPMDDIEVYANDIESSTGVQIGNTTVVSASTDYHGHTFSQSTNLEGGDEKWITFKFLNDSGKKFIFNGMKVWFTKCSTGCGF